MSGSYREMVEAELAEIDAPPSSAAFVAEMTAVVAADKLDRGEGDVNTVNMMNDALSDLAFAAHQD